MKIETQRMLRTGLFVIAFYAFFSVLYFLVLAYNNADYVERGPWVWLTFREYWYNSGMQYLFFFFSSLLIWLIAVFALRNKKTIYQVIAVLILIPFTIYGLRELRYAIYDSMGVGRLRGRGTVWDLYIPFLFLLFQFTFFFAYRSFKENQRKILAEGELRQAALRSELSAIKAQLNPHFLYNVFNTINASVPAQQEHTRNLIATLADLFRYQLQASRQDLVTLREEMNFVEKYLQLEKARFEERLTVNINVPEEHLDEKVPPMILQPLVENSIRHGLSSLVSGGVISIKVYKLEGKLRFEIADTGKGVADKSTLLGKGVGLTNTKLRLQKMYNTQLEIEDNMPQGLKICFAI